MVRIDSVRSEDLSPQIADPHLQHLIPTTVQPVRFTFNIRDVNNAIANAIRRTVMMELPLKAMYFEYNDYQTSDPFLLHDDIRNRIRLIPVLQTVPSDTVFALSVKNTTGRDIDVKSSDISIIKGKGSLPFNGNFTVCTLHADKHIKISPITILTDHGYSHQGHSVACQAVAVALNETPINSYTGEGKSSSVSDPRDYRITFLAIGNMPPIEICSMACDNIILRVSNISTLLGNIVSIEPPTNSGYRSTASSKVDNNPQSSGKSGIDRESRTTPSTGQPGKVEHSSYPIYSLTIVGESDTIGNLLMRTIHDLYSDIPHVNYHTDSTSRAVTIKCITSEDINDVFMAAIDNITATFKEIKKALLAV